VLKAAGTKWNFLPFRPGLVGGHCIGVDPYYLTHKAEKLGYHPEVILSGRRINDGMGEHIANRVVRQLVKKGSPVKGAKVGVLGLTFKEDCPDLRNSKVIDVITAFQGWDAEVLVHDPMADNAEAEHEYGVSMVQWEELKELDALVVCVAHDEYRALTPDTAGQLLKDGACVFDVKAVLDQQAFAAAGRPLERL